MNRTAFVSELLQNLPEHAVSFYCSEWNYKENRFKLTDNETGKSYTLTLSKAIKGFQLLTRKIDAGELHFLGLGPDYKVEGGQWDCFVIDALLQASLLGEVIYG